MPNINAKVAYRGAIYADAGNRAKEAGKDIKIVLQESVNPVAKNIGNVKERKKEWMDALAAGKTESEVDGYIATRPAYMAFCNMFFLDAAKYIINLDEIIKPAPAPEPKQAPPNMSQIGDLLDAILQEQQEQTKTLHALLQAFNTVCGTISLNVEASRETVQRMGPKLGEMDKKLKNIEISGNTVSKTWPGHVNNTAALKQQLERYVSR